MIELVAQAFGFTLVFGVPYLLWLLLRFFLAPGGYLDRREDAREKLEYEANRDPEELRREAVAAHIERNKSEHGLWEHHWQDYTGEKYRETRSLAPVPLAGPAPLARRFRI